MKSCVALDYDGTIAQDGRIEPLAFTPENVGEMIMVQSAVGSRSR
jgi:hypothetical protein